MVEYNVSEVSIKDLNLSANTIYKFMGYADTVPDKEICTLVESLIEQTAEISKPSFYYKIIDCQINKTNIEVDDIVFNTERTITSLMRKSEKVAIFVATAGRDFQQLLEQTMSEGDMLSSFILDAIGSSLAEAVGDYMEIHLEDVIGNTLHTNRFSPGYCAWNIREQKELFSLLPNDVCGIELGESFLMYPIKSISGIIGIGKNVATNKYGCSICKNKNCYLRQSSN